ncbi:MAG: hypothetical protein WBG46_05855 [Nonlabens sp.]
MGTKVYHVTKNIGEIDSDDTCEHHFYGGSIFTYEGEKNIFFELDISVIDEPTNAVMRVQKKFSDKNSAISYLKKFVAKKPICEAIIIEKYEKEVCHYV